ncbi:hypothetical protein SAMN06265337_0955 [Hymenobacter gelipurpurascens]|uniref:Outer membrane protein beta-barrel domain-containing protein n=1 Tax=Hymenobacter gelipurpurascens TaxID=89968 RepID=A0A212TDA9_9BACT|nr:hypothetical protein [Hymenobacter gelipurpurascens]SNC63816.1 hypothetical protein SAMN06265337_0955 [Hymenobacter gelipurpurascens]
MRLFYAALIAGGLAALGTAPAAHAQRVLLRSNTSQDTLRDTYGPNRAFFRHLFLSYTPVVGKANGAGADLHAFRSAEFSLGVRQKYRLSQATAAGFDLRYARLNYSLKQSAAKLLPTTAQHYSEALVLHQALLEPYVRLNFGRRGNVVGHYIDLTGWGGWVIGTAHAYEDRPGAPSASRTVVHERGLNYLHRWPAGVGVRLGSNRYAAIVHYRLTNSYSGTAPASYPELPRWAAGLELGLF